MKFFALTFFICSSLFSSLYNLHLKNVQVISLGSDCEIAHQLRRHKISEAYFPLDWVRSEDIDKVGELLQHGFSRFLETEYLEEIGKNEVDNPPRKAIFNNQYKILFVHDFALDQEKTDKDVLEKYKRRIIRLYAALKSHDKIYFFRKGITRTQAQNLCTIIEKKWPKLDYMLVVLDDTEEIKLQWGDRVRTFFLKKIEWPPAHGWEENNQRWHEILVELGLSKQKQVHHIPHTLMSLPSNVS